MLLFGYQKHAPSRLSLNPGPHSPRWASQLLQSTSVLTIPNDLSECFATGPDVS